MVFEIGKKVYARRIGGDWTLSEILHHRETSEAEVEYFIHYEGFNRRLDEWVAESRIQSKQSFEEQHENGSFKTSDDYVSDRKMTRQQKRKYNEIHHVQKSYSEMDPTTAALEREYNERTKIRYINKVILGSFEMDTWYYSPYPGDYQKVSTIFVCEKCLKYMAMEKTYKKHMSECQQTQPPGHKVYQHENIHIFQVEGAENKLFCQNLCLLAKFFLDHKTLYFDVTPFRFYIAFEHDSDGYHVASYYSKEKESQDNYNVSCILTFPPYQRKGYGKFMISLSYEVSKIENKIGTPERPLSDLGHLTYRSYWSYIILDYLRDHTHTVLNISNLSTATGVAVDDIIETLQVLNLLKYWKGNYVACFSSKIIDEHLKSGLCRPPKMKIDPTLLTI